MKKLSIFIVTFLSVSIVATAQNNIPEITDTLEIDSAVWSDEYVDTPSNFPPTIQFDYEPTLENVKKWAKENHEACDIYLDVYKENISIFEIIDIPADLREKEPCLLYLLEYTLEPVDRVELWIELYPLMKEKHINELYLILYKQMYEENIQRILEWGEEGVS